MQAVGVLVRVDQTERAVVVQTRRERQLHDVAGAGRVRVELRDPASSVSGAVSVGQLHLLAGDAHLGAVTVLARDVRVAARVVTDEDRTEPGHDALGRERGDAHRQLGS